MERGERLNPGHPISEEWGNAQPPVSMSQLGLCLLCPVDSGKRKHCRQTLTDPEAEGKFTGESNLSQRT